MATSLANKDVAEVAKIMSQKKEAQGVQQEACTRLGELASSSEKKADEIVDTGGLQAIVGALQRFPSSDGVQSSGFGALAQLIRKRRRHATRLADQGITRLAGSALLQHSASDSVQAAVGSLLASLNAQDLLKSFSSKTFEASSEEDSGQAGSTEISLPKSARIGIVFDEKSESEQGHDFMSFTFRDGGLALPKSENSFTGRDFPAVNGRPMVVVQDSAVMVKRTSNTPGTRWLWQLTVYDFGLMDAMSQAMQQHPDSAEVQRAGCLWCARLLAASASTSGRWARSHLKKRGTAGDVDSGKQRREAVLMAGAAGVLSERVVEAMSKHPEDAVVQCAGSAVLAYTLRGSMAFGIPPLEPKQTVLVVGPLIEALKANPDNASAQEMGCNALCHYAQYTVEHVQNIAKLGGIEVSFAALRQHSGDAWVERAACRLLARITQLREILQMTIEQMQSEGCLEATVKAVRSNPDDLSIQDFSSASLTELGVTRLVATLGQHRSNAAVQEMGCYALVDHAQSTAEAARIVVEQGGVKAAADAMRQHPSDAGVGQAACELCASLVAWKDNLKYASASILAEGCAAEMAALAKRHPRQKGIKEASYNCLVACAANSPEQQAQIAREGGAIIIMSPLPAKGKSELKWLVPLVSEGELDAILQETVLPQLSMSGRTEVNMAVDSILMDRKSAYGFGSFLKDTVLPGADVAFHIVQLLSFWKEKRYQFVGLIATGMILNGLATAQACSETTAMAFVNLFTFGTGGLAYESLKSWKDQKRSANIIWYKIYEAVESSFSMGTAAYDIVISGYLKGYLALESHTLAVRYAAIGLSLICLPLTGYDMAVRSIYMYEQYAHLRHLMRTLRGKAALALFHFSEISANLILIPFAFATRPTGIFKLILAQLLLMGIMGVLAEKRVHAEQPAFCTFITTIMFGMDMAVINSMSSADAEFIALSWNVAVARPVPWLVAWGVLLHQAADRPTLAAQLEDPTIMGLWAIAAIGFLGYLIMFLHQWQVGRWTTALMFMDGYKLALPLSVP